MSQNNFSAIIEVRVEKSTDADGEFIGYFEGIASTPAYDLEGDRFSEEVLKKNAERLVDKPILLLHGKDPQVGPVPVGRILEAKYVDGMLRIKAGIYKVFEEVWRRVKEGFLKALSVGGLVRTFRRLPSGGRVILDADILEVSLTPRGVNPDAQVIYAFGKSYRVEEGVITGVYSGDEGLAEVLAQIKAEFAELRRLIGPLIVGKSAQLGDRPDAQAERRPKALVSGLYSRRSGRGVEEFITPVFDQVWARLSHGYKKSGGLGGEYERNNL
ncbi:MAG: hypothetical protein QW580_07060 [Nitrososphaerota archaeon]